MRKFVLTVLTVSACLLLVSSAGAQHKSRSAVKREHPSPQKSDRSPSKARSKPLPSLGGGTLAPPEPRPSRLPTPGNTITPEMKAQLDALSKPARRPSSPPSLLPMPGNTIDLPARAAARSGRVQDARNRRRPASPGVRRVVSTDLSVRSDFNSFFVGTLQKDDHFRVRAMHEIRRVDKKGKVFYPCYFFGDALGNVDRGSVWVRCDGLESSDRGRRHPIPRRAAKAELHKPGRDRPNTVTTREHLRNRFASRILPETPDGGNGRVNLNVRRGAGTVPVFRNYNPLKANDLRTRGFFDRADTISADDPNITLKGRYITKDRQAVALNLIRKDPVTGRKEKMWVFVRRGSVQVVRPR